MADNNTEEAKSFVVKVEKPDDTTGAAAGPAQQGSQPAIRKDTDSDSDDENDRLKAPNAVSRNLSELSTGTYERIENGVYLTWKDLNYTVGAGETEKTILNNITGHVGPGDVVVILGPSGSGKTSLLSILSGTREHTGGHIYYQGREKTVTKSSEDIMGFGGNASYVAQDDILQGSLTVEETLRFAAQLKINNPEKDKEAQVDAIIKYLGLETARKTLVGTPLVKGLSGGQKRRLSIGIELVTQPGILFLDEVTSGLDATSAYQLLRLISKLARLGHAIIMTLHQPTSRIFELMCECNHKLLILESGNLSYFGYAKDSTKFFDSIGYKVPPLNNATDYYLDLVNRDFDTHRKPSYDPDGQKMATADVIKNAFRDKKLPKLTQEVEQINAMAAKKPQVVVASNHAIHHFLVLMKRNTMNLLRNPGIFWLRLVLYASLCVCLGTLFWDVENTTEHTQDRINLLFFAMAFFSFMSISAMPAFVEERGVYMRERMNNHYGTIPYVLADFLASLPWVFMLALVCSGILYSMVQLRWGWDYFGMFLLTFWVTLVVAENLMTAISASTNLFMVGLAAGSGLLGLYMTLGGFAIRKPNIPDAWKWAHYGVSYHTYSFELFMDNDFKDNFNVDIGGTGSGNAILKDYGMGDVNVGRHFLILCIMIAVYRIIFYILLKYRNRRQR